jgi:hypothetical protein
MRADMVAGRGGRAGPLDRGIRAGQHQRRGVHGSSARPPGQGDDDPKPPSTAAVRAVCGRLRTALDYQDDASRKRVARAFIHELRVDDERRAIKPVFRLRDCLPDDADDSESEGDSLTAVRNLGPQVGAEGLEPPTPAL